jgi:hypothetical protein
MSSKPEQPIALFFADAHLDICAWANRPQLAGDSMRAFQYICDYAISSGVRAVFGAGDLIDVKKPAPEVVQFTRDRMNELEHAGIPFYFIQGQHEYSPDVPWFNAIHSWPMWLNQKSTFIGNDESTFKVYGIDWRPGDKLQAAFDQVPRDTDILVMHQVWEDFMGEKRGCEGSFAQVPYATNLFTGDFHVTSNRNARGATGQPLKVISPGSTNLRKVDEMPDKFFYVMFADGSFKAIQIPSRAKYELNLVTEKHVMDFPATFKNLTDKIRAHNMHYKLPVEQCRAICRVTYLDSLEDVYNTIVKTAGDSVELFLKPVQPAAEEGLYTDRDTFDAAAANGLVGMMEAVLKKDDVRYKILSRLLHPSVDMKVELQLMKKERGLV